MPICRMESVSSRCACVSRFLRGWAGSGWMRWSSIRKAPVSRCLPSTAPAWLVGPSLSGSDGNVPNVRAAALRAASAEFFTSPADFIEEGPRDVGFLTAGGVEGDGDAVGDTSLELCQIGNDGVKGQAAEMCPQLL